ncbi:MAG: nucleotidyl transferase AbiEii/AbiGii toxin family protein [Coriobacteriia bacterium]|nr:nucleotidyl transferase AbiEii/AbiGii toxin family protein [Coriobacteriia bacterium]
MSRETVEPHREVIDAETASVLHILSEIPSVSGFYLAGGTAAALQLGHRQSLDLDLFTERPWSTARVLGDLAARGSMVIDRQEEGTLVGEFDGVRVSLFWYEALLLAEPVDAGLGVPLASLLDIGCMKLIAISQRGSRKDFIDLYHLAAAGVTVRDIVRALPVKYPGVRYNVVHLLRSLAYFDDAESEPEPVMLVPHDWGLVRTYAIAESTALLAEIAPV